VNDTPEREPLPLGLPLMMNADGTKDNSLFADRLHPNDLGYTRMWTVLSPLLVQDLQ
jgi:lysophospholipase L1-like esterase